MDDFTVRRGHRKDAADAARLWVRSAGEHAEHDPVYVPSGDAEKIMRRFLADLSGSGHSCLLVSESGGEIVGFLSGELRDGSPAFERRTWAAVEDIYVAPEHRSRGIGRALLNAFGEWAREKGADGISLQVAAQNSRARNFYKRLGFREISVYEALEF